MSKRIVITGGAGFIGQNLSRRFLKEGHDIVVIDNYFSGKQNTINEHAKKHILELQKQFPKRLKIIEENINTPFAVKGDVDEIYNLACPASPPFYGGKNAMFTLKTSTYGVDNMLALAKEKGAKFLQASTSEVYGDPDKKNHPQNEAYRGNVSTIGPRACYDEGKRVAETLVMEYYKLQGVDTRIVRIFNTYGPFMNPKDGRVVSNFINQAINNEPITLYGNGLQTRSFCYVDDLIEGMVRVMDNDYIEPINLGNPTEHTIKETAELIKKYTKSSSEFEYKVLPTDDPRQRNPDITLAKSLLDWEPQVSFEEGMKKTIEYYKELKNKTLVSYHK